MQSAFNDVLVSLSLRAGGPKNRFLSGQHEYFTCVSLNERKKTNKKSKTQKWINHRLQLTFPPTPWLLGLSHISELALGFTLLVAQEGRGWASTTERWCSNCGGTKQKNTDQAWDSDENPTAVWETFLIKTLSHESRPTVLHAFYFEIKRWSCYNKLCTLQTVCCHAHIILQLPDPFSIAVGQHDEQVRWTLSFSDLWPTVPAEEASGNMLTYLPPASNLLQYAHSPATLLGAAPLT